MSGNGLTGSPCVSVIVPVYNGAETIRGTVECLLVQSRPAIEIIVVDDGSNDRTVRILEEFGDRIRIIKKANGGPASARNAGIREAAGEFIAFTDSDCFPAADWLEKLLAGFGGVMSAEAEEQSANRSKSIELGGTGGIVRSADRNLTGEYVDLIRLLDPEPDERGEIPYLITANACFRKRALVAAGLFDEGFRKPGGEEAELCYRMRRAGYTFRLAPTALVRHKHRQSLRSLLRTLANYGEGAARIARLWPERRIEGVDRLLVRRLLGFRAWAGRFRLHRREHKLLKSLYFSFLDYLRQPAFLWGYRREERDAGSNQRHNSML